MAKVVDLWKNIAVASVIVALVVAFQMYRSYRNSKKIRESIDLMNLVKFHSLSDTGYLVRRDEMYIVVLPVVGCDKCDSFFMILDRLSFDKKITVILPHLSNADFNRLRIWCTRRKNRRIEYFYCRETEECLKPFFSNGALLMKTSGDEIIALEQMTSTDQFTTKNIERILSSWAS